MEKTNTQEPSLCPPFSSSENGVIKVSDFVERKNSDYKENTNVKALLQLNSNNKIQLKGPQLHAIKEKTKDFIVLFDNSSSMSEDHKIESTKATVDYMIDELSGIHNLCLFTFNHKCNLQIPFISAKENKEKTKQDMKQILKNDINAEGQTDIGLALEEAIKLIRNRNSKNQTFILLLTDGQPTSGLKGDSIVEFFRNSVIELPNVTLFTFGYGSDHDSILLRNLAEQTPSGVYHYINNSNCIGAVFGECLGGILSTIAYNIEVELIAMESCRISNIFTKAIVREKKEWKNYVISIGNMFIGEQRNILLGLSLSKIPKEELGKLLLQYKVSYVNCTLEKNFTEETVQNKINMNRINNPLLEICPIEIVEQFNRNEVANVIAKSAKKAKDGNYDEDDEKKLEQLISIIEESSSYGKNTKFSKNLIKGIIDCKKVLNTTNINQEGVHISNAIASMYSQERSTFLNQEVIFNPETGEKLNQEGNGLYKNDEQISGSLKGSSAILKKFGEYTQ